VGRLLYTAICSLDGYTVDSSGSFDWAAPNDEVHSFVNDLVRPVRTFLYGRAMYDVMRFWESPEVAVSDSATMRDFAAIWKRAEKVVYSTTLSAVTTARTRLERAFEPTAVRDLLTAAESDVGVGGPTLAAQALHAGLVDEISLFLVPVVVGGGTRALPSDLRLDLVLRDERRFTSGVVHLDYAVRGQNR
jgi:dihydrofolate reductase